jgi:plasmid stabilization system protein ParE
MRRVKLTVQAQLDLDLIWDFIAQTDIAAADRVLADIREGLRKVAAVRE